MKYGLITILSLFIWMACNNEKEKLANPNLDNQTVRDQLVTNYPQLPEREIIRSLDNRVYAQYAIPTEKYGHGILGDKIEAEQLVVVVDSVFYELTLPSEFVFEDISPRLYDVDGDDELEFITIRTNVSQGAGIAIYKIIDEQLVEYAYVPEIGTAYRWLNIVAINDLDNDGIVELVWIQTPHIGGILKVAKIKAGTLKVLAEKAQYSNHAIGERNLCLSILTELSNQKVVYVPNQSRNKIVGITFKNHELEVFEEITQAVEFSKTLASQYSFSHTIEEGNNCIDDK
jgi:hypothetical protein